MIKKNWGNTLAGFRLGGGQGRLGSMVVKGEGVVLHPHGHAGCAPRESWHQHAGGR